MKNPKLWIWLGVVGVILACSLAFAPMARATDKPQIIPPPKTVVVTETKRDYSAALIGAGITYWLMRRHAKRNRPEPIVVQRECPVLPPTEREQRIVEECGK